jgi:O-antigen polymerase
VLGVSGFWLLLRRPGVRQLALLACLMPILLHTQLEYPLYQSPVHWLLVLILVTWPIAVRPANRRRCPHSPRLHAAGALRADDPGLLRRAAHRLRLLAGALSDRFSAVAVLPARTGMHIGIGSERLRKDRALSYIIRYQSSANVEDLEAFNQLGRRWIVVERRRYVQQSY